MAVQASTHATDTAQNPRSHRTDGPSFRGVCPGGTTESLSVRGRRSLNSYESKRSAEGGMETTYVSLVQQYLNMFQLDNATWLAERCVSDFPRFQEGIYLLALCHYRAGKPKTSRYILDRSSPGIAATSDDSTTIDKTIASMNYLSAQCSYDLGEYSNAETTLLKEARRLFKPTSTNASVDDWIVQTTPCPIPNGAAGLQLLGKICRKSNRQERAIKYFRMSLQLDPFLFTSFQALCELGVEDLDAAEVFGGSLERLEHLDSFESFESNQSKVRTRAALGQTFDSNRLAPPVSSAKTPLQPSAAAPSALTASTHLASLDTATVAESPGLAVHRHNVRSIAFDTPGLTPIALNDSTAQTPMHNNRKRSQINSQGSLHTHLQPGGLTLFPTSTIANSHVVRRARQVANRQYYPPSPDSTPSMTSVTNSMRYLHGLGSIGKGSVSLTDPATSRSLFHWNGPEAHGPNLLRMTSAPEIHNTASSRTETNSFKESRESKDVNHHEHECISASCTGSDIQQILDLLTIAGSIYHCLCQYRCRESLRLLQLLPPHQQVTPWALQQQGRAFLELGDFQAAQRSLEYMHKIDSSRMQGLELLSTVYWQLKKEMDLANLAQIALDWDYLSPEAHCVVGNCFSLQKDHEMALVFFKRSLQLDPDFTYTHTLSGYEYMSNEDFDKALSCFRQALRTDERHYNAWYGLGAIYYRQEKFDLAEYHFQKAVSIHPSSSVLRCNLGMSQFANGKAYQALETLSEAFRLDPSNPQARFQRATIYSALHRPEEALAELKSVRDAAPREATVHFAMGKVLKRLGRPDEAMKCFLTAMDLDPKDNQLIKSAMDKLDEPDVDEEAMAAF